MKHFFIVTLVLFLFSGCDTNNEDDGCLSPSPESFSFYLKNQSTGEFLNVTDFDIDVHKGSGELVGIRYISLLNYVSFPLGEQAKSDTYTVRVGDEVVFDVLFTLERVNGEPCPRLITNNLEIEGVNYEIDSYSDVFGYRIIVFITVPEMI